MANRRMFSLDVVDTDKFLDLPATSQSLYFHLGMRADDDGFVSSPKRITKMVNCAEDDMNVLISRGFIIPFKDGVIVIRHWRRNNYIRSDRYTPTVYQKELALLSVSGGVYDLTDGIPVDNHVGDNRDTQVSIGKISSDKDKKKTGKKNADSLGMLEQKLKEHNFSEDICESLRDWIQYKRESKFTYTETGMKNLLNQMEDMVRQHGEDAVRREIQESIAAGWKGIAWKNIENEKPKRKGTSESGNTGLKLYK